MLQPPLHLRPCLGAAGRVMLQPPLLQPPLNFGVRGGPCRPLQPLLLPVPLRLLPVPTWLLLQPLLLPAQWSMMWQARMSMQLLLQPLLQLVPLLLVPLQPVPIQLLLLPVP